MFEDSSRNEDTDKGACGGKLQNEDKSDTSISATEESDISVEKMVCKYQSMNITAWSNSWVSNDSLFLRQ